ncbi:mannonate dehydratase [Allorhizobium sp. BGMRC 0089]|uniref:mannonate dehydratase n=1 Tax=Allorhizobium sonneratiae TaxID=2934936 RepID=UPI002033D9F6|nr:mannonate dehydratase [Allorhizobium sonneratiae]MCM2293177.1 mannonate dehydratase [Allorhizobium sonneratiae]
MYLGTQLPARDDSDYIVMKQLGVDHVSADPPGPWTDWTLDHLIAHRKHVESFGITLDMLQLPMPSSPGDRNPCKDILTAGPKRDEQIDGICQLIRNCAKAGIPSVKYNFNYIGIPRTPMEPGRGGSRNEAFRFDKTDPDEPGPLGVIPEEVIWERVAYFLSRVVPVASEVKVRLACHPHDPYTPPGYKGVSRILGTVEGMKRFVSLHESPWHGLNFCIGTVAEMLDDPDGEIDDVIRWFGTRGKLFNIHYRNIRGHKLSFMEVFPDEGSLDMIRVMQVLREVDYRYMVMPDHAPTIDGRDPLGVSFAFCYGYIAAALQACR